MRLTVLWAVFFLLFPLTVFAAPAEVPRTGQTTTFATGDDGNRQAGMAWPDPRFTVQGECATDNLTGLMWSRNARLTGDIIIKWQEALDFASALVLCGHSDWRLPNITELESLVDVERTNPALPAGHPFTGVPTNYYWSSSTYAYYAGYAWSVYMDGGYVTNFDKDLWGYVWPVRGGQ
jgi:hypothetical protein